MKPGLIESNWLLSPDGRETLSAILNPQTGKRKVFGLLEQPVFPPKKQVEEFVYKIMICGKSGVGKTSTGCRLSGQPVNRQHHDTPGIQTFRTYWPCRIHDLSKTVLFHLQLYEAGEITARKFDHVLPACKKQMDAVMFVFSFADLCSFEDMPNLMSRMIGPEESVCRFVVGTKLDLQAQKEVSQRDVEDFEKRWKLPILPVKNSARVVDSMNDLSTLAPILDYICDQLWLRDQILAGNSANSFSLNSL